MTTHSYAAGQEPTQFGPKLIEQALAGCRQPLPEPTLGEGGEDAAQAELDRLAASAMAVDDLAEMVYQVDPLLAGLKGEAEEHERRAKRCRARMEQLETFRDGLKARLLAMAEEADGSVDGAEWRARRQYGGPKLIEPEVLRDEDIPEQCWRVRREVDRKALLQTILDNPGRVPGWKAGRVVSLRLMRRL